MCADSVSGHGTHAGGVVRVTVALAVRLLLGALLIASAASKASAPGRTVAAMATFGVHGRRAAAALAGTVVAVELALGAGVIAGVDAAAWASAALMLAFAAALGVALARGGAGRPCACLGPRSRVSPVGVARNLALAAAFGALPFLPASGPSRDAWLAGGLVLCLVAVVVLAVMVLALAREVSELRLSIGPQMALEIDDEGPALGSPTTLADEIDPVPGAVLAVAVFTSEGCHICRALEPAVDELARDPLLAVGRFDEHRDGGVWLAHDIPGSPFAVVLDPGGVVLAKGTFNSFAQLQGMLAVAERRREGMPSGA